MQRWGFFVLEGERSSSYVFDSSRSGNRGRLALKLPITVSVSGFPKPTPALLLDISEGGCRMSAQSIFLVGSAVAFKLMGPQARPIRLRGTVRHVAPNSRNPREIEFGVEFGGLSRDDAAALSAFIAEARIKIRVPLGSRRTSRCAPPSKERARYDHGRRRVRLFFGGMAFSLTRDGSERVLHDFGRPPDGEEPRAALLAVDGTLYGTTSAGGALNEAKRETAKHAADTRRYAGAAVRRG